MTKQKDWEVKHDQEKIIQIIKFYNLDNGFGFMHKQWNDFEIAMKNYAEHLLTQQKKEIVEMIKSNAVRYQTSNNGREPYDTHGYRHASSDIIKLLTKE